MASHDDEERARLALLVLRLVMDQHSYDTSKVRSADEVAQHFAYLASWGFMDELRAVTVTLQDLVSMQRIGMVAQFDAHTLKSANKHPDMVEANDAVAVMHWRLLTQVLAERASSMLWHVWCVPGLWAGFLASDEAVAQESLKFFKKLWCSYAAAQKHALPTAKQIADRHSCDCRAAHDMARLCEASQWVMNGRIRYWAALICQEKFVEDALGDCRDAEVRQGTNKELKSARYWEVLMQMKQFEKNRRREVEPVSEVALPTEKQFNTIFDPFHIDDDPLLLKGVMSAKYYSPTPASEKDHMLDARLLIDCFENDAMGKLDDAWHASLVPPRQFVMQRGGDGHVDLFFTASVHPNGLVTLPVERVESGFVRLKPDVDRLQPRFIFDHASIRILQVSVASPLRLALSDDVPLAALGTMVKVDGVGVALLEWQSANGFAGVSEATLANMTKNLDVAGTVTVVDDGGVGEKNDHRLSLVVDLIRHIQPSASSDEISGLVQKALHQEYISLGEEGMEAEGLTDDHPGRRQGDQAASRKGRLETLVSESHRRRQL